MKVNFYANLRALVGSKTVEVVLEPGGRVSSLLDCLVERFPALRPRLLDEHGALYSQVHVFINGHDVLFLPEKIETVLNPEDKLDIFPPVGGGAGG